MTQVALKQTFEFIERLEHPEVDGNGWERLVTSVVADPENIDSYGNKVSEEEIRTMMLRFMGVYQNMGVNHLKDDYGEPIILNGSLVIVESWQVRQDEVIGGKRVPKGAWVMTVRVMDDEIWAGVLNGSYTGFSMEAFAKRVPLV